MAPPASAITSRRHPIVQTCRRLASRRDPDDPILLDGAHLISEALAARVPIDALLTRRDDDPVALAARSAGVRVFTVSADVLDAASPVRTASGLVALARWSPVPLDDVLGMTADRVVVLGLVDVQDPGNVGAAIRSADALGASAVVTVGHTADPGGWRALRGAMGSTFRLPIARSDLAAFGAAARRHRVRVAATVAEGGEPIGTAGLRPPVALLLGNEGAGLGDEALALATSRVHVPMRAGVNSLNVSVTAALLLYELRAQGALAGTR